jgi:biopolymer transport protein ExbB
MLFSVLLAPTAAFADATAPATPAAAEHNAAAPTAPAAAPAATDPAQAAVPAAADETGVVLEEDNTLGMAHDLSPWGMYQNADVVVKAVMIGLAIASIITWTIWIAKGFELLGAKRRLRTEIVHLKKATTLKEASESATKKGTLANTLVHDALEEMRLSANTREKEGIKERVAFRLERLVAACGRNMSSGTGVLATIGSTAPFVGLFGTVWGIMNSFIGIAKTQTTNLAVVAPGIAEALLATALGGGGGGGGGQGAARCQASGGLASDQRVFRAGFRRQRAPGQHPDQVDHRQDAHDRRRVQRCRVEYREAHARDGQHGVHADDGLHPTAFGHQPKHPQDQQLAEHVGHAARGRPEAFHQHGHADVLVLAQRDHRAQEDHPDERQAGDLV